MAASVESISDVNGSKLGNLLQTAKCFPRFFGLSVGLFLLVLSVVDIRQDNISTLFAQKIYVFSC